MQKMLNDIVRSIEGGSTFSKALERQNGVFSKVYINLIRAGEAAGVLETVLNRLADSLEKQKEFAEKTKGALIYPIIVVITMIGVATMMMVVVVPKLAEMYRDLGAQLPLVTQIMIVISQIMIGYWWALIGVLAGSIALFNTWIRTKKGREKFERFLLWLPVFGVLRQKVILTEFCRTVSLLLGAGISMLQALEIVSDAIGNTLYHDSLVEMKGKIEKGVPLSQALADPEMYPMILKQMAAVGEETGKLDEVLFKLGKYFESESEHAIKNLTTAIEPMMMIVLGVGVGGLVVSIIMPIYNLSSVVK
jgi:type IV pilus assembly protein PilC